MTVPVRLAIRGLPVLVLLLAMSVAHSAPIAYIAARHAGQVAAVNTATHEVLETIDVGDGPIAVSVSPDGERAYVTLGPQDEIAVIDAATRTVVNRITVGDNPTGVALGPDGSNVYVVNTGARSLSIINAALGQVTAEVPLGNHPFNVTVHPDGSAVYVSGDYPGQVSVVDPGTATVSATIPVGVSLGGLSVHPSGQTLYVVDSGNNELAVIDTNTFAVTQRVPVGVTPVDVTLNPDGTIAYVSNLFGTGAVSVIDTATNSLTQTISLPGPALAQGAAITPDGATLYVALRGVSGVLAINTANNAIIGIVPVGGEPTGFGDFVGPSEVPVTAAISTPVTPRAVVAALPSSSPVPALIVEDIAVAVPIALMPGAVVLASDDVIYANDECIFVLDFQTGIQTPIIGTPNPGDPSRAICNDPQLTPIRHVSVSRDRKRIMFNVGEDFTGEIATRLYLIDLPSRLSYELLPSFARVGVGGVDFAPNGDMYSAAVPLGDVTDPRVAEQSEVYRISADFSTVEQVTDLPNRGIADISISPDGTKLAFNTLVLSTNNLEVFETDLDGTNPRIIIQSGALWLDSVHDPEHSPDSSKVVYSRMRIRLPDGSPCGPNWSHGGPRCHDLFVQSVDGGTPERISPIGATSIVPDWKDNHIVYAFSTGDGTSANSWIGNILTDQHGFTMAPFGNYNLFAKWID
ncbi:MAG: YVTN family beta-propeller protein [Gammaproteobacteria bacterium]|jgi:YVTN family beta-propeller protein